MMLSSILCWVICSGYLWLVSNSFSKRLFSSCSVSEAIKIRKKYLLLMKIERILYPIFCALGAFCVLELASSFWPITPSAEFWAMLWVVGLLFYVFLIGTNTGCSPFLIPSTLTMQDVVGDYVLFLRGFGTDNYLPDSMQKNHSDHFSESLFCKIVSFFSEIYAVGRPEELITPGGAKRVYLDNATWKTDVDTLMAKAKVIVILVNDKPNCVWEIINSERYRKKTLYIINNVQKFENACNSGKLSNSTLRKALDFTHEKFYAYYDGGFLKLQYFDNSKKGYWKIVDQLRIIMDAQ